MKRREVKAEALRNIAAYIRQCPTEGYLWEGTPYTGTGDYTPDEAGKRASGQFHDALVEIAGELDAQADALSDTPGRRAMAAQIADDHRRAALQAALNAQGEGE